jgi:hypothetical protein
MADLREWEVRNARRSETQGHHQDRKTSGETKIQPNISVEIPRRSSARNRTPTQNPEKKAKRERSGSRDDAPEPQR